MPPYAIDACKFLVFFSIVFQIETFSKRNHNGSLNIFQCYGSYIPVNTRMHCLVDEVYLDVDKFIEMPRFTRTYKLPRKLEVRTAGMSSGNTFVF